MSWKHTKRSQIAFTVTSIALSLVHLGSRLLGRPAQFLMESPGTLIGVRPENKNVRGPHYMHQAAKRMDNHEKQLDLFTKAMVGPTRREQELITVIQEETKHTEGKEEAGYI